MCSFGDSKSLVAASELFSTLEDTPLASSKAMRVELPEGWAILWPGYKGKRAKVFFVDRNLPGWEWYSARERWKEPECSASSGWMAWWIGRELAKRVPEHDFRLPLVIKY